MKKSQSLHRALIWSIRDKFVLTYNTLAKEDRVQIRQIDWDRDDDFCVHVEIEHISEYVLGYARTIMDYGAVKNPKQAIDDMQQLDIFGNARFAEWYFESQSEYTYLVQSVELLDYLRLLVCEYLMLSEDLST